MLSNALNMLLPGDILALLIMIANPLSDNHSTGQGFSKQSD